jgi:hypothetical protein
VFNLSFNPITFSSVQTYKFKSSGFTMDEREGPYSFNFISEYVYVEFEA